MLETVGNFKNELLGSIGEILNRQPASAAKKKLYKKKKTLGMGSYGTVKEAIHLPTNTTFAIKIIDKKLMKKNANQAMLKRELTITQEIHHKNIVRLVDWFETRNKVYLVFELASGGELFDRIIKKGKFTEKDAADIIYTIVSAVAYLHDRNIVHRDLKPENLLYKSSSEDADLMIADFGVANIIDEDQGQLNTFCGSPGYAAPEIITRSGHGKPVDVWSIGVIAYILLCGYHPFKASDVVTTLNNVTSGKLVFHTDYWTAISQKAKDFIIATLSPKPSQRPTAHQCLFHPWLLSYSPLAQRNAKALFSFINSGNELSANPAVNPAAPQEQPFAPDTEYALSDKSSNSSPKWGSLTQQSVLDASHSSANKLFSTVKLEADEKSNLPERNQNQIMEEIANAAVTDDGSTANQTLPNLLVTGCSRNSKPENRPQTPSSDPNSSTNSSKSQTTTSCSSSASSSDNKRISAVSLRPVSYDPKVALNTSNRSSKLHPTSPLALHASVNLNQSLNSSINSNISFDKVPSEGTSNSTNAETDEKQIVITLDRVATVTPAVEPQAAKTQQTPTANESYNGNDSANSTLHSFIDEQNFYSKQPAVMRKLNQLKSSSNTSSRDSLSVGNSTNVSGSGRPLSMISVASNDSEVSWGSLDRSNQS